MLFVAKFEKGFDTDDLESAHAELMEYLVNCVQEMNLKDFEFQNLPTREAFYREQEEKDGTK